MPSTLNNVTVYGSQSLPGFSGSSFQVYTYPSPFTTDLHVRDNIFLVGLILTHHFTVIRQSDSQSFLLLPDIILYDPCHGNR